MDGIDALREPGKVRRKLRVVLAGERTLYWKLTAMENLLLFGGLHDLPQREVRPRAAELLELVGLSGYADVSVEKFSTGMRKRLAIARALIHRPPILILDEPTAGLDPHGVEDVWEVLRALREGGTTLLMATHNMLEAERLPTRLLLIEQGRLLADGTPQGIAALSGTGQAAVLTLGSRPEVAQDLLVHELGDGRCSLTAPVEHLPALLAQLQADAVPVIGVEIVESGLWEAFLRLTGRPFDRADIPEGKE